jgi:Dolichyl-phosphate-mannose-protein mannosyltransferase
VRLPAPVRRLAQAPYALVLLIAIVAAAWGMATLSRYGLTFDSPSLFYAGDRTLFYLGHRHVADALDFLGSEPAGGFHHDFMPSPEPHDPLHYPVLPGVVCAVTDALTHAWLAWLNPVDGHHLGLVLMHAFALLWYGLYATRLLGRRAGFLASLFVATYPSALGHSFNNAKDWPCAEFYGIAVLAAAVGIVERRARPLLAAGLWLGIALSCKFNAIFVLVTLAAWIPIAYLTLYWRRRSVTAGVVGAALLAPYLAAAFSFLAWPWLYQGKDVRDYWHNVAEYVTFMVNYGVSERHTWALHPFRCLVFMTPPVVLGAALVYALTGYLRSRRDVALWSLLLLWTAIPLVRIAAPRSNFYDANRHFIEYIPGFCAMAAMGAIRAYDFVVGRIARVGVRRTVGAVGAAVVGVAVVWPIAAYHPYETTYFNAFVGGLGGAQRRELFHYDPPSDRANLTESDYWFNSSREGLAAFRRLAHPGDTIGLLGPWAEQTKANWLAPGEPPLADVDKATYVYAARDLPEIRKLEERRPIVVRVERGGGLIYEILGPGDGHHHDPVSP